MRVVKPEVSWHNGWFRNLSEKIVAQHHGEETDFSFKDIFFMIRRVISSYLKEVRVYIM